MLRGAKKCTCIPHINACSVMSTSKVICLLTISFWPSHLQQDFFPAPRRRRKPRRLSAINLLNDKCYQSISWSLPNTLSLAFYHLSSNISRIWFVFNRYRWNFFGWLEFLRYLSVCVDWQNDTFDIFANEIDFCKIINYKVKQHSVLFKLLLL